MADMTVDSMLEAMKSEAVVCRDTRTGTVWYVKKSQFRPAPHLELLTDDELLAEAESITRAWNGADKHN